MNTDFFLMHVILLGILTVVSAVVGICFVWYYFDPSEHEKHLISNLMTGAFFITLSFLGLSWWITSANQPWVANVNTVHEIKDVTYPDSTKVQMFTCDGVHHNVTAMFGKVVDDKEWQIRRVRWSPLSMGLSYSSMSRCQGDRYFLEQKKGDAPSIEFVDLTPTNKK